MTFVVLNVSETVHVGAFVPTRPLRRPQQHVSKMRIIGEASSRSSLQQLRASLVGLDVATVTAAGSIVISTAAGMLADKHIRFLHGAGTMVTILVASHFSNLNLSPSSHHLYELCWTKLLPASLALLLLSPTVQSDEGDNASDITTSMRTEDAVREEIGAVSVPFVIGCLGSVLGCLVAFLVSVLGRENSSRAHSHILKGRKHFFWLPGHLLLRPSEAAVAAGCLCASYIGGSANFFSCASIISKSVDIPDYDGASGVLSGTFGSSASDLLVMALYFSTVTASLSSTILQRWFPGRVMPSRATEDNSLQPDTIDPTNQKRQSLRRRILSKVLLKKRPYRRRAAATIILVPLSFSIVQLAHFIETTSRLPGMGSLAISVLAIGTSRLLRSIVNYLEERQHHKPVTLLREMNHISSKLSDVCFYMLFASIGSTANLGSAIFQSGWHSASSFIFAAIALLVHIFVIVFGSLGAERLFPSFKFFPLGIDEIATASNAAIGGPVTAAALAAGLAAEEDSSQTRRKGLILAATTWGIVGYAVATAAGVALCKVLLAYLLNSSLF